MALVYKAQNKFNGKVYIGVVLRNRPLQSRIKEHLYSSNRKHKTVFYAAIHKYGFDTFEWDVIESGLDPIVALEKEKYYINLFRSFVGFDDANGYNSTLGGDGVLGHSVSEGMREKNRDLLSDPVRSAFIRSQQRKKVSKPVINHMGQIFDSIKEASGALGIGKSSIGKCIKGICSQAGGFQWRLFLGDSSPWPFQSVPKGNFKQVIRSDGKVYNSIKEASLDVGIDKDRLSIACKKRDIVLNSFTWGFV
jgi:GIY-YIG catalytic domain/NUMOD1 domain